MGPRVIRARAGVGGAGLVGPVEDQPDGPIRSFVAGVVDLEPDRGEGPGSPSPDRPLRIVWTTVTKGFTSLRTPSSRTGQGRGCVGFGQVTGGHRAQRLRREFLGNALRARLNRPGQDVGESGVAARSAASTRASMPPGLSSIS